MTHTHRAPFVAPEPPAAGDASLAMEQPTRPSRWTRLRLPIGAAGLVLFSFWLGARLGPLTGASAEGGLTGGTWLPTPVPAAVYVGGAVRHPGLYPLGANARIANVIARAGGPSGDADLTRLNLAASPHDGDTITVPHRRAKGCAGR